MKAGRDARGANRGAEDERQARAAFGDERRRGGGDVKPFRVERREAFAEGEARGVELRGRGRRGAQVQRRRAERQEETKRR